MVYTQSNSASGLGECQRTYNDLSVDVRHQTAAQRAPACLQTPTDAALDALTHVCVTLCQN